jgi:4-amino-4-deoxy-L-arabinose transferase-like glycosyltransferase
MQRTLSTAIVLLIYLIVGGLFAINTPDWQAPDEPAHYNYVRQLAAGKWPIIEEGDYDQAYQSEVISSGFDPRYSVSPFEYEDYQPPMYYLLLTPVFWLTGGSLLALRLVSVLLGAGVVLFAYLIVERLFPGREWLALSAAVFVAFLPQHVAMLAAVNNDSLAELLIAAILWLLIGLLLTGQRRAGWPQPGSADRALLAIGLLLGLGLLTKATVYIMVPVIGLSLLWLYRGKWRPLIRNGVMVYGPAVLLGGVWWVRNLSVYGSWDVLGIGAHNAVVIGQPQTVEWIAERGLLQTLVAFGQTTFQSFWGQFGWMGVPMPGWIYRLLLLLSLAAVMGLALAVLHGTKTLYGPKPSRPAITLALVTTFAFSLLLYLAYNLTFVQHQGRYLFPALIPISAGVVVGLSFWLRPLIDRWPAIAFLLPAVLLVGLVALDVLALFQFIVPSLAR